MSVSVSKCEYVLANFSKFVIILWGHFVKFIELSLRIKPMVILSVSVSVCEC